MPFEGENFCIARKQKDVELFLKKLSWFDWCNSKISRRFFLKSNKYISNYEMLPLDL
jgi:hypothetical protein